MLMYKRTFAYHFENWYETYRAPRVREVTKAFYGTALAHIRNDPIGDMELKKIKRKDMQEFFNRFGATRRKTTVLDLKGLINGCFSDAVHDGIIKINPVARVEVVSVENTWSNQQLKEIREAKKWMEIDEYKKLKLFVISMLNISFQKNEMETIQIKKANEVILEVKARQYPTQMVLMVIYIAMKTGARFSEILGLTKADYDFQKNILNIDKTWDYKYNNTFTLTKNTASVRKVVVDKEFTIVMKNYLYWLENFEVEINQGALLVKGKQHVHNSVFNGLLRKIFNILGIEPITLHKLRHTHASILIASGISIQVVAKRLGHNDTNMVQTTYGHLLDSVEEEENEKIMDFI